eukprot:TRINITY_DN1919_c0_g1_i1.p1 TRINITY_DN1919_c0_g1~~TRINITY_DN1919_c0_g1_i1.p1  ORF type:complete len:138 (-),score=47.89 TRINITY_DN1919_c0_g1_i1:144-557(-)
MKSNDVHLLNFYLEVDDFRSSKEKKEKERKCIEIYNTYFDEQIKSFDLPVDNHLKEDVRNQIRNPTDTIFDLVYQQVEKMLNLIVLPAFLKANNLDELSVTSPGKEKKGRKNREFFQNVDTILIKERKEKNTKNRII